MEIRRAGSVSHAQDRSSTSHSRRARSGCLTCRRRKVKCDEQQPNCYNCTRLRKVCVYGNTYSRPKLDSLSVKSHDHSTTMDSVSSQILSDGDLFRQSLFEFASGDMVDPRASSFTASVRPTTLSLDTDNNLTFAQWGDSFGSINSLNLPLEFPLDGMPSMPLSPESRRFSYFLEHVEPPFITPCDSMNWARMRRHMAELGARHSVVASAIVSVEALYEAMANGEDITNATSLYYAAKSSHAIMLEDERQGLQITLTVTFLLCCFEIVAQQETVSITLKSEGAFIRRLEEWSKQRPWPPVARRIEAWLKIIHAKALHLGGRGLLAAKVHSLLSDDGQPTPCLSLLDHNVDPITAVCDSISSTLFEFYLETQIISTQSSGLNRHHRSRGFPADEIEVQQTSELIRRRLYCLWQGRPSILKLCGNDLCGQFSQNQTAIITRLIDICKAAYFTEVAHLERSHGQWPSATPEAQDAMLQVREIVENINTADATKLGSGFIWPLYIYAVESTEQERATWAVEKLRQVKSPVCRSDFIADLVQGIVQEQRKKGERVDSRYFSIQTFGIAPPFL
ncbi:hypothetical protein V1506DRAFT_543005 [Lipomyces tetrasporus]